MMATFLLAGATVACSTRGDMPPLVDQANSQRSAAQSQALGSSRRTAIVDAAARIAKSVVSISVVSRRRVPTGDPMDFFSCFVPQTTERTVQAYGTGFVVRAGRLARLSKAEAEAFYEVHRGRPFYAELVEFMTSGPCFPMALERDDAVKAFRTAIGATDPAEAAPGTIRKLFAESKGRNAVHGSDSDENAAREIAFFFTEAERARLWG